MQWFWRLDAERWWECCEGGAGDAARGGARYGQGSQECGDYTEQEQAERIFGFEKQDACAGHDEDDEERAVRAEVAEVIEVIMALSEGVKDQKEGEQEHEACEDVLFPRESCGGFEASCAHPLHG
jgi:hypothetical protein